MQAELATSGRQDGTTCLMALIEQGSLTMASLGDAMGTLVRKDGSWRGVSIEHTTTARQDEADRITNNGGFILKTKI